jgi:hypothetical protein
MSSPVLVDRETDTPSRYSIAGTPEAPGPPPLGLRSFARDGRSRKYGTWYPGGVRPTPPRITEHDAGNQRNYSGNQVK